MVNHTAQTKKPSSRNLRLRSGISSHFWSRRFLPSKRMPSLPNSSETRPIGQRCEQNDLATTSDIRQIPRKIANPAGWVASTIPVCSRCRAAIMPSIGRKASTPGGRETPGHRPSRWGATHSVNRSPIRSTTPVATHWMMRRVPSTAGSGIWLTAAIVKRRTRSGLDPGQVAVNFQPLLAPVRNRVRVRVRSKIKDPRPKIHLFRQYQ